MDHIELLKSLIGEWTGRGRGGYPTIKPFEYIETLRFSADDRPMVHYEQITKRRNFGMDEYVSSHWENGFIRLLDDGQVQINNTQSGGRVEVLTGSLEQTKNGFVMRLVSTSFLNDPRMLETTRVIEVDGDTLHFKMLMRIKTVSKMTVHLEAKLIRSK